MTISSIPHIDGLIAMLSDPQAAANALKTIREATAATEAANLRVSEAEAKESSISARENALLVRETALANNEKGLRDRTAAVDEKEAAVNREKGAAGELRESTLLSLAVAKTEHEKSIKASTDELAVAQKRHDLREGQIASREAELSKREKDVADALSAAEQSKQAYEQKIAALRNVVA